MDKSPESFTFTVGKLERAHLIEFPSILLPPGATDGFWALQDEIMAAFGVRTPEPPKLQLRNVTQTSRRPKLRSLDIYRNGQRLAPIPSPLTNTSSKLSGLELNTEYTFQLILRTTAGTFPSNLIRVRTHTMSDTSGISVCFGTVQDPVMLENAKMALREMRAKWSDKIQIDTTHFVCTTPAATPSGAQASGSSPIAPGVEYQRALQLSIPVVQPHWIFACHTEKKLIAIAPYNLGAVPPTPSSSSSTRPQSMSQAPTRLPACARRCRPSRATAASASPPAPQASAFVNSATPPLGGTPEEDDDRSDSTGSAGGSNGNSTSTVMQKRMSRTGTMNREFKFPTAHVPSIQSIHDAVAKARGDDARGDLQGANNLPASIHRVVTPSNIEVPPPPPVEKEVARGKSPRSEDGEDELGDTVEIEL
ncbi:hypothetical protein C8J57DRAFT_1273397 [Mycena rebaudengoi]|nr:hypothetical protein C8J57DRAFT_1273397 [Mycena rebaudengoi]